MKKQFIFFALLSLPLGMMAQSEIDALRFSTNELTGTARGMAMGGAFGALGGDITGIASNPAGIGVYRSSEVVTSLDFASVGVNTNLDGSKNDESKFNFSFNNAAYVGYCPLGDGNVKSFNYGFSYNRLKNFGRNYLATGNNQGASLSDYIAGISTAKHVNVRSLEGNSAYDSGAPWLSVLGYQGGLILLENGTDDVYWSAYNVGKPNTKLKVSEEGYIKSYDFSGGVNILDQFFLGVTFAITDLYYSTNSSYDEDFGGGDFFYLDNYLESKGSGYQVSVGAIYRPINELRLGVAYHSPTWYSLTDLYWGQTGSYINGFDPIFASAPPYDETGVYDYRFQTPYQWTFSLAGVIGTKAIISVDYEIKDYTSMSFKDTYGYNLEWDPDQWIKEDYRMASTVKAGVEYRLFPEVSLRAGYAWMQSPLETSFRDGNKEVMTVGTMPHYVLQGDTQYATFGLGIRITPQFYIDGAFVYRTQTSDLYGYSPITGLMYDTDTDHPSNRLNVNPATFKEETLRGILTIGYKF